MFKEGKKQVFFSKKIIFSQDISDGLARAVSCGRKSLDSHEGVLYIETHHETVSG